MNRIDEIGALLELRPVRFLRELAHALLHGRGVAAQREGTLVVARRFGGRQVRVERRLDVDHELPAVGHVHDHVGTQRTVVALHVHLLDEVAVLDHAGEFGETLQASFRPTDRAPPAGATR